MSVYKLIKWGESCLESENIENPFNESISIMCFVLKKTLDGVIVSYENKIPANLAGTFKKSIFKRSLKEPYAYITNEKEFYSLPFFVDKHVLIPRPDTECLVEETLKEIKRFQKILKKKLSIIDLGTGSGAIAISIAKNTSNVIIYAVDNSFKSLEVAKKNAILNGVENRIVFAYFDILKPNICWLNEKTKLFDSVLYDFDIIISNPPYIKTGEIETLAADVRLYEPIRALDGGTSGLKFYRKIFELAALSSFKKMKSLLLEIDCRERAVIELLYEEKFNDIMSKQINFINDLNKKERVVRIRYGQNDN